ncbi:hypothetical protein P885DRAFT_80752, partial [Corynascus similis CBS 632.67]
KIWDPATGECVSTLQGHSDLAYSVAWSQDGSRLASASDDETVKIWDLATGKCDGMWSVAHITCHEPKNEVLMFDGISSPARPAQNDEGLRIQDDEERNERIGRLTAADSGKFSDRDGTLSGTLYLAWAEGRLNNWPMNLTWQEDRMEGAWIPTTYDPNEEAEMSEDGNGDGHWKHVLWLRAYNARFDELGTA